MPGSLRRQRQRAAERTQLTKTILEAVVFQGPIPPPELLKQYDEFVPGAGDRILSMAEKEQDHRHRQERKKGNLEFSISIMGVLCALIITLSIIASAVWLVVNGYEIAGGAVGIGGIWFVVKKFLSKPSPETKPRNSQ